MIWNQFLVFSVVLLSFLCVFITAKTSKNSQSSHLNSKKSFSQHHIKAQTKGHDAILYHGENTKLHYVDEPELWLDIHKLLQRHNLTTESAKLCFTGAWILYDGPHVTSTSISRTHVLDSGQSKPQCLKLQQHNYIGSVQPLGKLEKRLHLHQSSITIFPHRNFNGREWSMDTKKGSTSVHKSLNQPMNSVILKGRGEWSLTTTKFTSFCFSSNHNGSSLCMFPEIGNTERIIKAHQGCAKQAVRIRPHYCLRLTPDTLHNVDGTETKQGLQGRSMSEDGTSCINRVENKEADTLEEVFLTHDLTSEENLLWPSDPSNIYRTELLDLSFCVFNYTCPNSMISKEYQQLIRELFIYHMDKIWNREDGHVMDEEQLRRTTYWLFQCSEKVKNMEIEIRMMAQEIFNSVTIPSTVHKFVHPELKYRPNLDSIIDFVWLVANNAAAVCHMVHEYKRNFWVNYIETFQEAYLTRLQEQWTNPKNLKKTYDKMLGRFGISGSFYKAGICVSTAINAVPNLQPFLRLTDLGFHL